MPYSDALDLIDYWGDHPPVHVLVAGYMGVKPRATAHAPTQEELEQLVAAHGRAR